MKNILKQSTAATVVLGPFVDSTDGVTAETALTIAQADIRLSKAGGAFAQTNNAAGATHMENGYYSVPLNTTDTGTLGTLRVAVSESGALPVFRDFMVVPAHVYDGLVAGTDNLQVDAVLIEGVDATNQINAAADTAISDAALATAAALATVDSNVDAILADTGTDGVVVAAASKTGYELSAGGVDAIWDEATSGHTTAGSFGQRFQTIRSGTAQAGAAGSITLDASASASDDFYNNGLLVITGGTGVGQARFIEDYTGATQVATVSPNWVTNPSSDSVFVILPFDTLPGASAPTASEVADAVWDEQTSAHLTSGSFGQRFAIIRAATAAAGASLSITLDASASSTDDFYNNCLVHVTAGTGAGQARFIEDYVGSTKVATISPAWSTNPAADSVFVITPFDTLPGASAPTVAEIADGVWDEARSGHTTNGTFGQAMQVVRSGTAQAGAASTITLDASASATNDLYNGCVVFIQSGTGAGQARAITDYVGATKVATVDAAWTTNPSSDSVFVLYPGTPATAVPTNFSSLAIDASGNVNANVTEWLGTAPATPTVAGVPEVDITHIAGSAVSTTSAQLGVNVVQISGDATAANNLEAAADGTGYNLGGGSIVAASVTGNVGGNVTGNVTGSVGSLAAQAQTDVREAVLDQISVDSSVNDASATTTSFVGAAGLSATDDFYNGAVLVFTSGTLAGLSRKISDYVGATRTITLGTALPATPANAVTFRILGRIE